MNDHANVPPRPETYSSGGSGVPSTETPTVEVVKAKPSKIATTTDERGRLLEVKFLSPLDRMRLAKILGKDSTNEIYMGYAALAFSVTKIDGEDVSSNTVREIEFLVDRLSDEGLEAVGKVFSTHFKDFLKGPDIDAAKN